MLAGLRTLLDCTRATLTAADCLRRLQIPKYLGKTPLEYWNTIRAIISKPEGRDIPDDELWNFLRHFDFSSVDLNTSESSTEALLRGLLAATATGGASNNTALQTWQALIVLVSGQASRAESITYNKLPEAVRTAHRR